MSNNPYPFTVFVRVNDTACGIPAYEDYTSRESAEKGANEFAMLDDTTDVEIRKYNAKGRPVWRRVIKGEAVHCAIEDMGV